MQKYITVFEQNCKDSNKYLEFINFLFNLCTLNIGQPYSLESLSEDNLKHLDQFKFFGIVLKKKNKKKFYVTPMIKCLFENISNLLEGVERFKFLIVETNFSVFAYISSDLDRSILESICEVNYVFNGLLVGTITRNVIRAALMKNIKYTNVSYLLSLFISIIILLNTDAFYLYFIYFM